MKREEKIAEIIGTGLEYYDGLTITQKRGLGTVEEYLASEIAQALSGICVECRELEWFYNEDAGDWSGIAGDLVKFALGVISIFYDSLFLFQHYVLYRGNAPKEDNLI